MTHGLVRATFRKVKALNRTKKAQADSGLSTYLKLLPLDHCLMRDETLWITFFWATNPLLCYGLDLGFGLP